MRFMSPRRLALAAIFVPTVVVMLQNLARTPMQLFFWEFKIPLIYIIVVSVGIGFVGGWLTAVIARRKNEDE